MKRLLLTAALAAIGATGAHAQIVISGSGSTTQNFDTLISTGTATWADNSTISGWYAQRTGTGTGITADVGSNTGGNLYSYGSASASDRALGSIGSSNATAGSFAWGVQFRNTSGASVTLGTLAYVGEQWRNSAAAAQTVTFWYQISSSVISSLTPNVNTGWTAVTALDFTSPITGGTAGALNGNLVANQVSLSSNLGLTLNSGDYVM